MVYRQGYRLRQQKMPIMVALSIAMTILCAWFTTWTTHNTSETCRTQHRWDSSPSHHRLDLPDYVNKVYETTQRAFATHPLTEERARFVGHDVRVVYYAQGSGGVSGSILEELNVSRSNVYQLRYDKRDSNELYYPRSTWTTGRNYQLRHLESREKARGRRFEWACFFDGDSKWETGSVEGFEAWLLSLPENVLRARPYILGNEGEPMPDAIPQAGMQPLEAFKDMFGDSVHTIPEFSAGDAMFNCFSPEGRDIFLPYSSQFDRDSWWTSQWLVIVAAEVLAQADRYGVVHLNSTIVDAEHNDYARGDETFGTSMEELFESLGADSDTCAPFLKIRDAQTWAHVFSLILPPDHAPDHAPDDKLADDVQKSPPAPPPAPPPSHAPCCLSWTGEPFLCLDDLAFRMLNILLDSNPDIVSPYGTREEFLQRIKT